MAKKQKKKRNKKYRQIYTTGGRLDMRTGGRVGYQIGKMVEDRKRNDDMSIDRNIGDPLPRPTPKDPLGIENGFDDPFATQGGEQGTFGPDNPETNGQGGGTGTETGTGGGTGTNTGGGATTPTPPNFSPPETTETTPATSQMNVGFGKGQDTTASQQRTDRIAESAARIQEGASGQVPDSAVIAGVSAEGGTKVDENILGTNVVKQDPNTKARVKTVLSLATSEG